MIFEENLRIKCAKTAEISTFLGFFKKVDISAVFEFFELKFPQNILFLDIF